MKGAAPEYRIHALFEALAAEFPHRTAVIFEDRHYSYRQLNSRANRLAYYLLEQGIESGSPVGVYMARSQELVVAMLAIFKMGSVCVPLEPAYPAGWLAKMAANSGLAAILCQSHLAAPFGPAQGPLIHIDQADLSSRPDEDLNLDSAADDLAFVLYTSGSTGEPKGVRRSHRSTTQQSIKSIAAMAIPNRVELMRSAISHIIFVIELVTPILAACPVVIARAGRGQESGYLIRLIRKYHVTRILLTPTLLHELLNEPDFAACTSLEWVGCSGEPLPRSMQERFFTLSGALLTTGYGCTEFPTALGWDCRIDDKRSWYILGRPTDGTAFYLLDDQLNRVAPGDVGEIYLGGSRLADGYWERPDLTAQRFIANPFADEAAPRLYRTGDLARYHADGTLEFIGRVDGMKDGRQLSGQVNIRGYRVELGEIEAALDQHPLIERGAVIAVADANPGRRERRIVAYYSSASNDTLKVNELRAHLAGELPDFMQPASFVRLDSLPLTPNGKIDRAALPVPGTGRPHLDEAFVAPRDTVEAMLAEIWQDVLGLDEVGVNDDFLLLGGHSLAAMRIAGRLSRTLAIDLQISDLFNCSTIAELAGLLAKKTAG